MNTEDMKDICYGRDDLLAVAEQICLESGLSSADGEVLCEELARTALDYLTWVNNPVKENYITIENYETLEDCPCEIGDTIVSFTCESCGDEVEYDNGEVYEYEYPYKYIVCVEHNGRTAEGVAWQKNEFESAYHDGFEVAYEMACKKLGITPMNR